MFFQVVRQFGFRGAAVGCLALASAAAVSRAQAQLDPLHVEGQAFRDTRGASVLLRGLNLTGDAKVPPFRGIDDERQLDVLETWGVNVVRLLFTWEAFEPQRRSYDDSYLDYYASLVEALGARHIYVVVDFHQDAFSRFTTDGCGDGFPAWALSGSIRPDTPDNGLSCADWGIQMTLDPRTAQCWNDFYDGVNGVRPDYLTLLDRVSQRLQDQPAVLGYDMLNEPAGDEVSQIQPLYAEAARVLRARDPDAILFVSPGALTSAGLSTTLPRPEFDNFAYAPHYYDAVVSQLHSWLGTSLEAPIQVMVDQAGAWNVPLFVGEFGAPSDGLRADEYIDEFYARLDAKLVSAAQWNFTPHWSPLRKDGWNDENFSIVDDTGRLRSTYRVRPYPARVAGKAVSFREVTGLTRSVELVWDHDPASGETRVFAPLSALFGGSVAIDASGDVACSYETDLRYLRCAAETAGKKQLRLDTCSMGMSCFTGS